MRIYYAAIVFLAKVSADQRRHHRLRHLNEDISMSMLTPTSSSLIEESSEVSTQEEDYHQSKSGKSKKAACNLADFQQWKGEVGYVQNVALRVTENTGKINVYACGAIEMIDSAKVSFIKAGLSEKDFYSDAFVQSY